jgi:hypothetical protein
MKGTPRGEYQNWSLSLRVLHKVSRGQRFWWTIQCYRLPCRLPLRNALEKILMWLLYIYKYIYIVVPQCFAKHRMILTTSKTHTCWSSFFKWCTEVYLCCFFAGNWLGVVNPMINQPLFYQTLVDVQPFPIGFPVPNWTKALCRSGRISFSLISPSIFSALSTWKSVEIRAGMVWTQLIFGQRWKDWDLCKRFKMVLSSQTSQCPGVCTRYVELILAKALAENWSKWIESMVSHAILKREPAHTCTLMDFSSFVLPFLWRNQVFLTSWIRLMEIVFSTMQTSMLRNRLTEINPPEKRVQKNVLPVYPWP